MSPGDISDLALSDDIAFRVQLCGATPPPQERYWRGPVLHDFDGRTWRRITLAGSDGPLFPARASPYSYVLSLEPHQHNWIFALDWPEPLGPARSTAHERLHAGAVRSGFAPRSMWSPLAHSRAGDGAAELPARRATCACRRTAIRERWHSHSQLRRRAP